MTRACALVAACLAWLGQSPTCEARATFKVSKDGPGFNDRTPTLPVGGNEGTTLGEQRQIAVDYAFELWSGALDSTVPIEVRVDFSDLDCGPTGLVLGRAGPASYEGGIEAPGADPRLLYASALANSLAGEDLSPNAPDITMQLNTAPDDKCRSRTGGYYYGLDAKAGDANDLVEIVLHELAHGLGFASTVDPETGELVYDSVDSFAAQLVDLETNRPWSRLTPEARAGSAANPRRLVWAGAEARRIAAEALTFDQPRLSFEPMVPGWSNLISDTSFGQAAAAMGVTGRVLLDQNCNLAPPDASSEPFIALFTECDPIAAAATAADAGAAGALLSFAMRYDAPPPPLEATPLATPYALPLVVLRPSDARNVQSALARQPLTATIASDPSHRLGTDPEGRPLMFSSNPISRGSSVSHVDPSMRPNQLMEPHATPTPTHSLALTQAFLQDIGWQTRCGDGVLDPTEECDQGRDNNSKLEPDGCRSDCRNAYCGDGVTDDGEECDDGFSNSDLRADGCRRDCRLAHCGDAVVDEDEECDEGEDNDDSVRDGCRTDCKLAHCGDGVIDALEQCDDGDMNDDERANACRTDCRTARCGDGAVDVGEQCDKGQDNGKAQAGACRSDCSMPRCGDHIVDEGEECDGGEPCTTSCKRDEPKTPPLMRRPQLVQGLETTPPEVEASEAAPTDTPEPQHAGGCGCRITPSGDARAASSMLMLGLTVTLLRLRARKRARRA